MALSNTHTSSEISDACLAVKSWSKETDQRLIAAMACSGGSMPRKRLAMSSYHGSGNCLNRTEAILGSLN
jgi:hypothetical protein